MKNFFWTVAFIGFALGTSAAEAKAQVPVSGPGGLPGNQPTFSPYLNMLRSGGSPTLNYFGLVRPEQNAISSFNGLQQQNFNDQQALSQLQSQQSNLPTTGHAATFLNLRGYFLNVGGTGGGGAQGTGGGR
jgi:hypothetical protein